jgi:hypothetical protein
MPEISIIDFGAVGDGQTNDATAIQQAIDACHASGGGRVTLPAGKNYLSGTITLKSNVELHIERGAVLQGSGKIEDYTGAFPVTALSVNQPMDYTMLLTALEAENIAVTGGGAIDGGGRFYIAENEGYIYRMAHQRPFTIFLIGCHNVTFRDIILRDGALWTLRLSGCEDVLIHGIHIQNDLRLPNNDGIDLDRCRNVRISDCHIVSGDDCICLKTCPETAGYGPCENITVTGCTLVSTSSALILGAECREPIRNVVFDACVIRSSHRGLAIHLSDQSDIENVLFTNMIVETRLFHEKWWGRAEPIYITAIPWTEQHGIGHVRHVRFINVLARSENGVFIQGWEEGLIDDILLENVRVEIDKWSRWPAGRQDIRPCPGEGMPEHPTAGFYLMNASNVTLRNCQVSWGSQRDENFHHALESHHVTNLVLENFQAQQRSQTNILPNDSISERLRLFQSVTLAGNGFDVDRLGGVGLNFHAQPAHQLAKHIAVAAAWPPDMVDQILVGKDQTGM